MRFISVCEIRSRAAEVLDELEREGEMIVTRGGAPSARADRLESPRDTRDQ